MRWRCSFLGLAALALLVPSGTCQEAGPAAKTATVPLEILRSRHLAVEIKVNGKGPFRVIFDTGAPVSLVNNRIAREAELVADTNAQMPAFFGMRGQCKAKTLEIGDLKVEDMPVIVMDHPALKAISQFMGPVDGIIGFPFFARFRMTLDYQAKTLSLRPVDYQPPDAMDAMMLMVMTMGQKQKPSRRVLAPSTVWGLTLHKEAEDGEPGMPITQVLAGSAAARAGLKAGDRLLVLDATWTDSLEDCFRAAAAIKEGQSPKVRFLRMGQEFETVVRPPAGL